MRSRSRLSKVPTEKRILQVTIDAVAFGGDGIARQDGKVIFVADSIPGEVLKVTLIEDKERFARGEVSERLQPAPYAKPSPCPYASRCGGCQWLEVPAEQQLMWKKEFIASALQRIGKLEVPADLTVTASPAAGGYRNRIKIRLLYRKDGRLIPGYFAKGRHEHVAIDACWIAASPLNQVLTVLASLSLAAPFAERLYEVELQHLADDLVTLAVVSEDSGALRKKLKAALTAAGEKSIHVVIPEESDAARLLEEDRGLRYFTYAGQFQQVNLAGNRLLRSWVQNRLLNLGVKTVLDLYCGSGNLSLGLAAAGVKIWGLEVSGAAIACAQENLAANDVKGAMYVRGTADQLPELFPNLAVDAVIVDPPRKGMAEALPHVLALGAPHIIYISCDPNTLARDLKLLAAEGYQIETCLGFDFFPQTYHVETAVALKKRAAAYS